MSKIVTTAISHSAYIQSHDSNTEIPKSEIRKMAENETNCREQFETQTFIAIAGLRAMMGSISFLTSIFVIIVIVYFKKYVLYTQRLILYLSISVSLNALTVITQAGVYLPMENEAVMVYCQISAYLSQTTDWSELVAICLVTLDLYLTAATNIKSKQEIFQVLLIFLLPPLINLLPFIHSSYGPAGPWCWIKKYDEDCSVSKFGKVFRIVLWYVPVMLMIFFLITTYIVIYYKLRKQNKQYISCRSESIASLIQMRQMIQKEIKPLVLYPVIFLFFNFFPLLNALVSLYYVQPIHALWTLEALLTPFVGVVITLVYTLDPETRQRLGKCNLRADYYNAQRVQRSILEYPLVSAGSDNCSDMLKKEELAKANNQLQNNKLHFDLNEDENMQDTSYHMATDKY